jgi:hypothetical protein
VVRVILISIVVGQATWAEVAPPTFFLEKSCLSCHREQKIPSELIYRRYLMKYSTDKTIRRVMLAYLEEPKKERSIMPKQFFLKFPKKEPMRMDKAILIKGIDDFIGYMDIKKRLSLP